MISNKKKISETVSGQDFKPIPLKNRFKPASYQCKHEAKVMEQLLVSFSLSISPAVPPLFSI